ncbi:hypothetical protein D3C84_1149540 [compost metagenome]
MGIAQRARRRFKPCLITGHQQQIKTTRGQPLRVDRADTGRSTGDEGRTLGLNGSHDVAPGRCQRNGYAPGSQRALMEIEFIIGII